MRVFIGKVAVSHGHQVGGDFGALHAKQNDAPATMTRKRDGIFQRRTRMRRKVGREKNVSEGRHKNLELRISNSNPLFAIPNSKSLDDLGARDAVELWQET